MSNIVNSDSTSVSMINKQISEHAMLTKEEEQELLKELKKKNCPKRQGIKDKLILSNLRLVKSIASKYLGNGLDFEDLFQAGVCGLMLAIDKFDTDTGNRLSTYATHWIHQQILRSIEDEGATIRIPVHMYEKISVFKKTVNRLTLETGSRPSIEEVAKKMNIKIKEAKEIESYILNVVSLDSSINTDGDSDATLADVIADTSIPSPEEQVYDSLVKKDVAKLLNTLDERDKEVIKLRYGIDCSGPHTLDEVGRIFGITRERARQIENRAMKRLRIQVAA